MSVPSYATTKAAAMKKTPVLLADDPSPGSLRNFESRSRGFQIGSPLKMTTEQEETMMPINDVTPKPIGIVKN